MGVEPLTEVIALWRNQHITLHQAIGKLLLLVQKCETRQEALERSNRRLENAVRQLLEEHANATDKRRVDKLLYFAIAVFPAGRCGERGDCVFLQGRGFSQKRKPFSLELKFKADTSSPLKRTH